MLHIEEKKYATARERPTETRRVLVCALTGAGTALAAHLSAAGYETSSADPRGAARAASESEPQVVIVEAGAGCGVEELARVARDLRAVADSLPLVVLADCDDALAREAAAAAGADDCFHASAPPAEILARLDALFWRVEVGRDLSSARARAAAHERRAAIDNFLELFETVRAAAEAGSAGVLALVAAPAGLDATAAGDALRAAHDFLSANLRRSDSVAFYGPDVLVAYLPRPSTRDLRADFAQLLEEFARSRPPAEVLAGFASFPEDGRDAEELIGRAESALEEARREVGAATGADAESDERRSEPGDGPPPGATDVRRAGTAGGTAPAGDSPRAGGRDAARGEEETPAPGARESRAEASELRAVRESRGGDSFETSFMPVGAARASAGTSLTVGAYEAAARERERRSAGALMPRRVLLTVSDPARMAQVNLLLRSAAYEVRAAFDGEQALALLRIERADLLVLDSALQGLGGLDVLRRLRERHQGRLPMPVLVLVPRGDGAAREEARALGAAGFVELPYDPTDLLERVRETGGKD